MTDFVATRPWGYINEAGWFIPLPKQPLVLGNYTPPCDVMMPNGKIRHVIEQPDASIEDKIPASSKPPRDPELGEDMP